MATLKKTSFKRIGVIAFKESAGECIQTILDWAQKHPDIQFRFSESLKPFLPSKSLCNTEESLKSKSDLLLTLGGDGTFLYAARLVRGKGTPILGVNLGKLGFLADVTVPYIPKVLDEIQLGKFNTAQRMMLDVSIWNGRRKVYQDLALNEVTFAGKFGSQMVDLRVHSQNQFLTEYWVDGLLVSTPTGSSAYSLSAGGPLIHPDAEAILLTPLNPTSLSVRPLLLPHSHKIKVCPEGGLRDSVNVLIDGRNNIKVKKGWTVNIKKSQYFTHILRPHQYSYFESLRNKLGWTGSLPSLPTWPSRT